MKDELSEINEKVCTCIENIINHGLFNLEHIGGYTIYLQKQNKENKENEKEEKNQKKKRTDNENYSKQLFEQLNVIGKSLKYIEIGKIICLYINIIKYNNHIYIL